MIAVQHAERHRSTDATSPAPVFSPTHDNAERRCLKKCYYEGTRAVAAPVVLTAAFIQSAHTRRPASAEGATAVAAAGAGTMGAGAERECGAPRPPNNGGPVAVPVSARTSDCRMSCHVRCAAGGSPRVGQNRSFVESPERPFGARAAASFVPTLPSFHAAHLDASRSTFRTPAGLHSADAHLRRHVLRRALALPTQPATLSPQWPHRMTDPVDCWRAAGRGTADETDAAKTYAGGAAAACGVAEAGTPPRSADPLALLRWRVLTEAARRPQGVATPLVVMRRPAGSSHRTATRELVAPCATGRHRSAAVAATSPKARVLVGVRTPPRLQAASSPQAGVAVAQTALPCLPKMPVRRGRDDDEAAASQDRVGGAAAPRQPFAQAPLAPRRALGHAAAALADSLLSGAALTSTVASAEIVDGLRAPAAATRHPARTLSVVTTAPTAACYREAARPRHKQHHHFFHLELASGRVCPQRRAVVLSFAAMEALSHHLIQTVVDNHNVIVVPFFVLNELDAGIKGRGGKVAKARLYGWRGWLDAHAGPGTGLKLQMRREVDPPAPGEAAPGNANQPRKAAEYFAARLELLERAAVAGGAAKGDVGPLKPTEVVLVVPDPPPPRSDGAAPAFRYVSIDDFARGLF